MKMTLSIIATIVFICLIASAGDSREVYLNNFPVRTENNNLDDYIRIYATDSGSLRIVYNNPLDKPTTRSLSQSQYVAQVKQVIYVFDLIAIKGQPKLYAYHHNLTGAGYRQLIKLPEVGTKNFIFVASVENDSIYQRGLGIAGPTAAGKDAIAFGLLIEGQPEDSLELLLHSASTEDINNEIITILEPFKLREPYGALDKFSPLSASFPAATPRIYLAGNPQQLHQKAYQDKLLRLKKEFGDVLTVHFSYPTVPPVAEAVRFYNQHGIATTMEAHQTAGMHDYFTNNNLYMTRSDNFSMSNPSQWTTTSNRILWPHHSLDLTRGEEALPAIKNMLDRAGRIGLTEYLDIDYVWPWNGRWGYGDAQIAAFRRDLAGTDEGIILENNPTLIHFFAYLALFTDYKFTPEQAGLKSWDDYTPVSDIHAANGKDEDRVNLFIFTALYHYEYLKFGQRIALYAEKNGVNYVMGSNPEDILNASDIYLSAQLKGVKKYGYEFFGTPLGTRAWSRNMRFYNEPLRLLGKSMHIIGEIAGGGHGPSRNDAQVAYAMFYDITCASKAPDYNMQYLEGHVWDGLPSTSSYHQGRWAHFAGGAHGFLQSHAEATNPEAAKNVVVIASRGILEYQSGMSNSFKQSENMADLLDRLHYSFDLGGKEGLDNGFIDQAKVMVYNPAQSSSRHFAAVLRWLEDDDQRILITHSRVPFTRFRGRHELRRGLERMEWDANKSYDEFNAAEIDSQSANLLSLVEITLQKLILKTESAELVLEAPYYQVKDATPLWSDAQGIPLISQIKSTSGRIIYIHIPIQPGAGDFALQVVDQAMRLSGNFPEATAPATLSIHRYHPAGGDSAVVWDCESFRAQEKERPQWYHRTSRDPGQIKLVTEPGIYRVYDFYHDQEHEVVVADDKNLPIDITHNVEIIYFGLIDSPDFAKTLVQVKETRKKVRRLDADDYFRRGREQAKQLYFSDFEGAGQTHESSVSTVVSLDGSGTNRSTAVSLDGWKSWSNSSWSDQGEAVSGKRALQLKVPQSNHDRWVYNYPQAVDVNKFYLFRAQVKVKDADIDDYGQIYIEQNNSDNSFVAAVHSSPVLDTADTWKSIELLFRPTTEQINLVCAAGYGDNKQSNPQTCVYFDDVELLELVVDDD